MNSFKVLGINYGGHDTSACLMIDGNPVACCEEERYNKIKHTREFPINAINDCLKKANLNVNDLDEVAFTYNPDILKQLGSKSNMRRSLPNKTDYKAILKEKLGYEGKIKFHPHHMCHIASAYYPSGFENALLISNDGIGEIDCSLMASGKEGAIKVLDPGNRWPNSLGLVYSAVTVYLGWKPHYDEGIVMGLAPYGDDSKIVPGTNRTYKEIFEEVRKTNFPNRPSRLDCVYLCENVKGWKGNSFCSYPAREDGETYQVQLKGNPNVFKAKIGRASCRERV